MKFGKIHFANRVFLSCARFWSARKSSKIFVEHTLNVARIQFRNPGLIAMRWYSGLRCDHRFIIKRNACTRKPV